MNFKNPSQNTSILAIHTGLDRHQNIRLAKEYYNNSDHKLKTAKFLMGNPSQRELNAFIRQHETKPILEHYLVITVGTSNGYDRNCKLIESAFIKAEIKYEIKESTDWKTIFISNFESLSKALDLLINKSKEYQLNIGKEIADYLTQYAPSLAEEAYTQGAVAGTFRKLPKDITKRISFFLTRREGGLLAQLSKESKKLAEAERDKVLYPQT